MTTTKTNQLLDEFHQFLKDGVDLSPETITSIELLIAYTNCDAFKEGLENKVFNSVYKTINGDDNND